MWPKLFIVLLLPVLYSHALNNDLAQSLKSGVKDYFTYGDITPEFKKFMATTNLTHAFRNEAEEFIDDRIICALCEGLLDGVLELLRSGYVTQQTLQRLVTILCTSLVYESEEVCDGAISTNIGIIMYIIEAKPEKRADQICGIIGQSYGCAGTPASWSVNMPDGTPEINKGIISDEPSIKVLQLTDIHYDSIYEPGSLGVCAEPVCCTAGTVATSSETAAGFWGDYRDCDTPLHAIDDAFSNIVEQEFDLDYIYYTGDIISHRVWDTSYDSNAEDITLIFDMLAEYFPNTPIYPVLGNHEPHPLNVFAPLEIEEEGLSTQWLFDLVADVWSKWLDEAALETVRKGGYYTILVRPGFRIVALNSNAAYTMNWWLIYDDVDPYGQLQWLADTLYEAEQNNEKVHILSHLPSSDGTCYRVWSHEYRRIVDRFAGIISASFNGHTHRDELVLYHSSENSTTPISIAWNGGSLTTFSDKNPNYKVFEVDSESYEVLDYDVWAYNITEANLNPDARPNWFKLYNFKTAYGLDGSTPSDIRDLVIRMVEDRSLVEQYFKYSVREADTALASGCSSSCQQNLVCKLLKSEFSDETQCLELTSEW